MDEEAPATASLSIIRPRFSSVPITFSLNLAFYNTLFVPIPTHEMYFSSISTFLNLLILKCQAMDETPFDTHPKTMMAAVFSFLLLVYSFRVEADAARVSSAFNGVRVVSRFVWLFWSFTLASLVSLLLPDSIRPILYLLCFVPLFLEVLDSFCGRIWREFEEWLNDQRVRVVRNLMVNRRRIGRLPV